jgi:hypothetical protein
LLDKSDLEITDFIFDKISVCNHHDVNGYSFSFTSVIFNSHINLLLFLYGLYNDGHFGIDANIADCKTVISFADDPK